MHFRACETSRTPMGLKGVSIDDMGGESTSRIMGCFSRLTAHINVI